MPDDIRSRPTLEATIALLEATLEATHDGILVVGRDRRIVRCNQPFLDMFHLDRTVVRGDSARLIAAVSAQLEDPAAYLNAVEAFWRDPETSSLDILRFKDGRIFERFVAPHRVGAHVVGGVISYRDVTRALATEQALEEHRAFLEKAQHVAHLGSWIAELDGSDRLTWSTETCRIFGVAASAAAKTLTAFFDFVHPDDREAVRAACNAAVAGEHRYDIEYRIIRTDGGVRWVHERADVVRDDGRPLRLIGTVQDITERRTLEEQLRQAQKMEAIGRLAGGIAHDLNNALTAIAGYADLALGDLPPDHAVRRDIEEIRRASERAGAVTRQLLAFSRKQLLEPRPFDLNDTVGNLVRLLQRAIGPDIELRTTTEPALPRIKGDPGQIEQALVNLAVNARDAMPAGGRLEIATSVEEVDDAVARANGQALRGRYVVLRVTDTGQGMSAETQAHLFEPFFTTKDVGKGTGLGLSMVYGTVKQTGGFITVESAVGRGTTFRLYFQPADKAAAERPAPPRPRGEGLQFTVLVVDDEPAVRSLVASTLSPVGYNVLQAASGAEALGIAAANGGGIDLLVTDANMPGQNGADLAHDFALLRPDLPVIIMSGYTDQPLEVAVGRERVALLNKPFTPADLRQRIADLLKN